MEIFSLSHLALVLVTAIACFSIGAFWYSPTMFGDLWQKLTGLSNKDVEGQMSFTMSMGFLLVLVMVFGVSLVTEMTLLPLAGATGIESVVTLRMLGALIVWGLFVVPSNVLNSVYAMRPHKLVSIDMGYQLVVMLVAAISFGLFA